MKKLLVLFCLAFLCAGFVGAQDATYEKMVYVWQTVDGDTYYVSDYVQINDTVAVPRPFKQHYKVRLFGVDTPEKYNPYVSAEQPYSRESSAMVRAMMTGTTVRLDSVGVDVHGRVVARVQISDGRDLGKVCAGEGWGWSSFPGYPDKPGEFLKSYRKEIVDLQRYARKEKKGLWGQKGKKLHPGTWKERNPGGGA